MELAGAAVYIPQVSAVDWCGGRWGTVRCGPSDLWCVTVKNLNNNLHLLFIIYLVNYYCCM